MQIPDAICLPNCHLNTPIDEPESVYYHNYYFISYGNFHFANIRNYLLPLNNTKRNMNKLLMTGALFITGNTVKIIYDLIKRAKILK